MLSPVFAGIIISIFLSIGLDAVNLKVIHNYAVTTKEYYAK